MKTSVVSYTYFLADISGTLLSGWDSKEDALEAAPNEPGAVQALNIRRIPKETLDRFLKANSLEISNNTKLSTLRAVYTRHLEQAVKTHPQEYAWQPGVTIEVVVDRMMAAIERGSYNKDSRAIKATFKELGIKYTYTAMREWLKAGV